MHAFTPDKPHGTSQWHENERRIGLNLESIQFNNTEIKRISNDIVGFKYQSSLCNNSVYQFQNKIPQARRFLSELDTEIEKIRLHREAMKKGSARAYSVLGVSKDASDTEIKTAFRSGSLAVHPD